MSGTSRFTINGKTISAPRGATLVEAGLQRGTARLVDRLVQRIGAVTGQSAADDDQWYRREWP